MKSMKQSIRILTETAILLAVALVLDALAGLYSPFKYGGSISPAMLPIFILAFRRGWKSGLIAGFLFGILQSLVGMAFGSFYFLGFIQYALDYLVAFTVLGVAGFFTGARKKMGPMLWGILLGSFLRYLAHGFSGVVFWGMYAPEGMNVWFYSFILYNLPYMAASAALCGAVAILLQKRGILSLGMEDLSQE
jgi:thiamine transporter